MNAARTIHDLEMLALWMNLKKACCKGSNNEGDWIDIVQKATNKLQEIIEGIKKEEAMEFIDGEGEDD